MHPLIFTHANDHDFHFITMQVLSRLIQHTCYRLYLILIFDVRFFLFSHYNTFVQYWMQVYTEQTIFYARMNTHKPFLLQVFLTQGKKVDPPFVLTPFRT